MAQITHRESVHTRIATLRDEAAAHGNEDMVAMCDRAEDYELYGYDTAEPVTPDELGVSITQYVEAICESLDEQSGTGAVDCGGHTVYAQ